MDITINCFFIKTYFLAEVFIIIEDELKLDNVFLNFLIHNVSHYQNYINIFFFIINELIF